MAVLSNLCVMAARSQAGGSKKDGASCDTPSFVEPSRVPRSARQASAYFAELVEDGRVFERRDILRDRFTLRERAQQPAHDLARTGLRQVVAEADVLRLRDRADLFGHPRAQLV